MYGYTMYKNTLFGSTMCKTDVWIYNVQEYSVWIYNVQEYSVWIYNVQDCSVQDSNRDNKEPHSVYIFQWSHGASIQSSTPYLLNRHHYMILCTSHNDNTVLYHHKTLVQQNSALGMDMPFLNDIFTGLKNNLENRTEIWKTILLWTRTWTLLWRFYLQKLLWNIISEFTWNTLWLYNIEMMQIFIPTYNSMLIVTCCDTVRRKQCRLSQCATTHTMQL